MNKYHFTKGDVLYQNRLMDQEDLKDFKAEGPVKLNFINQRLVLESSKDSDQHGDFAHWVLWCVHDFPDQIMIEWEFEPIQEPGLAMLFFAATDKTGDDIFSPELPARQGHYPEYHSGAINTFHLSYFRRKWEQERMFCTCNLRKSAGFHLVSQGADPIPTVADVIASYKLRLVKYQEIIQFSVNDLVVLEWEDDGNTYGPIYENGKIGFRQMAPLKAAYRQFFVSQAIKKTK
ncbi:DUF1961 family protein [Amphibacillus jilinensis]|uniref:DUF1961 family protein n=1 Tax=Amphibacillus jilinensis TaxID=1216008 RepID=UPI0002E84B8F|nr:DUF1961 family protein [Amphibacillus jilinensis]